jgi:hypothetical protein
VDEAAITQVAEPIPSLVPVSQPVSEAPAEAPARPERSGRTSLIEPVSSPAKRKAKPWLPIAAIVGVVAVGSVLMIIPRGEKGPMVTVTATPAPVAPPTPVPIVTEIQTKLDRARAHMAKEEYDEAIALLKAVQGVDADNAAAAVLLTQIDEAKRVIAEKAKMAEREKKVAEYLDQAKLARDRRDWPAVRRAVTEARKLDFQNALLRSDIESLDADATAGEEKVAEMEQQRKAAEEAEQNRQAAMKEAARQREIEAAKQREADAEADRKRIAAREAATAEANAQKRARQATPRPRARVENNNSDRPPSRRVTNREDERPPAPARILPPSRPSTPAPQPRRPGNVFRGGPPGG